MQNAIRHISLVFVGLLAADAGQSAVVYQTTSPYHQIQIIDEDGQRTLSFNGSWETCMSIEDPLKGHFSYTEYFQLPFLYNTNVGRVLMIGLGGGSTQRAFQHYHPTVRVDTVELDPVVVQVAKKWFNVKESETHAIHTQDGRMFLRRNIRKYDAILMDAYQTGRYGTEPPFHLVTQEFFATAATNLTDDGILAYNVIGTLTGARSRMVGNLYRTMRTVFPRVTWIPAEDSENVVMFAFKSAQAVPLPTLRANYSALLKEGQRFPPDMLRYLTKPGVNTNAPAAAARGQVFLDRFAPPGAMQ
jgi:spermidine synthase